MPQQPLPKALMEALARQFPALYSQEHKEDPMVLAHFSSPANGWDWYLWEGSPVDENGVCNSRKEKVDYLFYGLVCGFEDEIGDVSLSELLSVAGQVERDLHWQPKKLSEVRSEHELRRNALSIETVMPTAKGEDELRNKEGLTPAAQAERACYLKAVEAAFDEHLMQHKLMARMSALAFGEKVGWDLLAGMDIGPDRATVSLDELNQVRRQRVLPVLDAQQEAEYRQVFVRVLKDKRPQ